MLMGLIGPTKPAGGGGSWTPASVTTSFWYKADGTGGVLNNSGATAANSDLVKTYVDFSGNGRNLVQATTANQPTFTTGLLNGLPGVVFTNTGNTATSGTMSTAAFTLSPPFLVMTVIRATTTSGFSILWDGDLAESAATRAVMFRQRNDVSNHSCLYGGSGSFLDTGQITDGNNYYYYAGFDSASSGAASIGKISGVAEATGTAIGTGGITNGIVLSGNGGAGNIFGGNVYECFCIPSFTGTDKSNAVSYVQTKWGV